MTKEFYTANFTHQSISLGESWTGKYERILQVDFATFALKNE